MEAVDPAVIRAELFEQQSDELEGV